MSTFQKSAKVVYTFIMKTHFPFMSNKIGVTPFYCSLGAGAYIRKPFLLEKIGFAVKEELQK